MPTQMIRLTRETRPRKCIGDKAFWDETITVIPQRALVAVCPARLNESRIVGTAVV